MNSRTQSRMVDWISVASIVVSVAAIVVTLKMQSATPLPIATPPPTLSQVHEPEREAAKPKIALYFFTQAGCVPCQQLKEALAAPALAKTLERYEVKYVDATSDFAIAYNVKMVPTLIAVTQQRTRRHVGYQGMADLAHWLEDAAKPQQPVGKLERGGDTGPKGQQVQADLPLVLRLHNTGGNDNPPPYYDNPRHEPGKGSGLCVWTAINLAARRQNVRELWDLQEKMTHQAGGGWPERVDKKLAQYAPNQRIVNYESRDPALLELALLTGRMPAVTYNGHDRNLGGHYPSTIAHMVDLVYLDDGNAAILDNNFEKEILWMSRKEFLSRWTGKGNGWAVVLLAPRPPPVPHN